MVGDYPDVADVVERQSPRAVEPERVEARGRRPGQAVLQQLDAPTARNVKIAPENREAILDGIYGAANLQGGT